MGYLITQNNQIITTSIVITEAELLAGGLIKNIPAFPAVRFKSYKVLYYLGVFNGTPYTGAGSVHVEVGGTGTPQFRFTGGFLLSTPFFKTAPEVIPTTTGIQYTANSQLQIHVPNAFSGGTGDLTLYLGAILFTV
jgi:hypothetical protein